MRGQRFVATFHPLIRTRAGRDASSALKIPPFVDGSCRREPDFESAFPAITALCRGGNFAPRLRPGDAIAYLTVRGRYLNDATAGWRIVSVLRVIERFESHLAAAKWYVARQLALPNNCLVPGNEPNSFDRTHRKPRLEVLERGGGDAVRTVRIWDSGYHARAKRWPMVLACEPLYLELRNPPQLRDPDMHRIFGRTLGTRTPPSVDRDSFRKLLRFVRRAA